MQATERGLGEALGQVYVTQEFPPANKQATLQMVQDIEAAMDQDIDTLDWMSAATKSPGQGKAACGRRQDRISRPLAGLLQPRHPAR